MKMYKIVSRFELPITRQEAWEFLSNPNQLEAITSDDLSFKMVDPPPKKMYEGLIMRHQVSPFPGVKLNWVTEITHIEEGVRFIDEQRFGPFRFWHHEHRIKEFGNRVLLEDVVHYVMPFSFIGRVVHQLFIRKMIKSIFEERKRRVTSIFKSGQGSG